MKEDQASFLAAMVYLFLMASAFFHSVRRVSDVGDLHHFFSAERAFFTRVWHLASHHGRVGYSELLARAGLDFLKNFSLALFIPVRSAAVMGSGETISRNFTSVSAESRAWFHSSHRLSSMIHLGAWFEVRAGVVLSVRIMGTWSLPKSGPVLIEAEMAKSDDVRVKSIVDNLPLAGSILVPRSIGVMRQTSLLFKIESNIVFPALLASAFVSHIG